MNFFPRLLALWACAWRLRCLVLLLLLVIVARTPRGVALLVDAEEEPFEYASGDSYYYYYEEEPAATTTKDTAPPKQKPKQRSSSSSTTASAPAEASVMVSGFTLMPREDGADDDEDNKVLPLWDESYLMEVRHAYGCILHDEKLQLDDELFGF